MDKAMKLIKNSPVMFIVLNLILYLCYGLLVGISLIPAVLFMYGVLSISVVSIVAKCCLLSMGAGIAVFAFLITALIVFGLAERLLSLGFRPGTYSTDSAIFARWLIYSGVHTLCLSLILPHVSGSGFAKLFYKIVGCKFGRDVFINTPGLHDAYLLEIGDNVVIGGKADINCHIFEENHLILNKVTIGSNVLIGANSYIMPGAKIGDGCDIGVGSVIRKNRVIEPGSLIMPLPAMPIRQITTLVRAAKTKQSTKR